MESGGSDDWRAAIDRIDARILDGFQSGLPLTPQPFDALAADVGVPPGDAIARLRRLVDDGLVRRVGPVLNPPVIGSSALVALQVPPDRFDRVARAVNRHPQVNHNYRRDHDWNCWFVVTAGTQAQRDRVIEAIADESGLDPLVLPMLTDYYVDLEFPVVNTDDVARTSERASVTPMDEGATALDPTAATVIGAVQDGLPIVRDPYEAVAERIGRQATDPSVDPGRADVIDALETLQDRGCVKRIGTVVDHRRVGYDSNCMVVWDVPDDERDTAGVAAGSHPNVTLCYHRPRRPERDWPYSLFTMVHGRDPAAVGATIDALASGPLPYPHERLQTTATLKQTGARYQSLVASAGPEASTAPAAANSEEITPTVESTVD